MQRTLRIWGIGIATVMLLALSAGFLGFAHKAPSIQEQQIAVAALNGYDVADICAGDAGDIHFGNVCPACHVDDGGMPSGPAGPAHDAGLRVLTKVVAPRESPATPMVRDPALGERAPPVIA